MVTTTKNDGNHKIEETLPKIKPRTLRELKIWQLEVIHNWIGELSASNRKPIKSQWVFIINCVGAKGRRAVHVLPSIYYYCFSFFLLWHHVGKSGPKPPPWPTLAGCKISCFTGFSSLNILYTLISTQNAQVNWNHGPQFWLFTYFLAIAAAKHAWFLAVKQRFQIWFQNNYIT